MKEQFRNIPDVLQKQILIRMTGSGLGIVMVLLVLAYGGSLRFLIPGFVTSLTFLADALAVLGRCADQKYVVIEGICEQIEYTGLRKKAKAIHIRCNGKAVRIIGQLHSLGSLRNGDLLKVYLAESTPVYEHDGVYQVTNFMAIRKER